MLLECFNSTLLRRLDQAMKRPHLYKHSHLVMILDTCHAGQVNSADYQFEKNQTSKYPQFSQKVDTSQVASTSLSLSLGECVRSPASCFTALARSSHCTVRVRRGHGVCCFPCGAGVARHSRRYAAVLGTGQGTGEEGP